MKLEGSCACGAVRFSVETRAPHPYQRCYCSICRKAGGGGGFLINLLADHQTLAVEGEENVKVFRAVVEHDGERTESPHERHFCSACGAHLWAWHPKWPELSHPVAGAIDTPLPRPPATTHMMVGSKAAWVDLDMGEGDRRFEEYPDESLEAWHRRHGLWEG